MSLIGCIAQRCKNTLDSLPDLLIAFAFVWGYLAPCSTPVQPGLHWHQKFHDWRYGGGATVPPCPPIMSPMYIYIYSILGMGKLINLINTDNYFIEHKQCFYFYYFESPLLTGSEFTYRQTIGHRRGGMLISTGLGWVSSRFSTNESIWGLPKTAGALTWTLPIKII